MPRNRRVAGKLNEEELAAREVEIVKYIDREVEKVVEKEVIKEVEVIKYVDREVRRRHRETVAKAPRNRRETATKPPACSARLARRRVGPKHPRPHLECLKPCYPATLLPCCPAALLPCCPAAPVLISSV